MTGRDYEIKTPSSFTHQHLVRRRINKIEVLQGDDGKWVTDNEKLKNLVVCYCIKLFISDLEDDGHFITGHFPGMEAGTLEELSKEIAMEETKRVTMNMGSYKAPGPDGFQAVWRET